MDWMFMQQCEVRRANGTDGWNKPLPPESETSKCRCQFSWRLIKDRHGKEVMSRAQFWLPSNVKVAPGDQMVYQDEVYEVITVGSITSLGGLSDHIKVWC